LLYAVPVIAFVVLALGVGIVAGMVVSASTGGKS